MAKSLAIEALDDLVVSVRLDSPAEIVDDDLVLHESFKFTPLVDLYSKSADKFTGDADLAEAREGDLEVVEDAFEVPKLVAIQEGFDVCRRRVVDNIKSRR